MIRDRLQGSRFAIAAATLMQSAEAPYRPTTLVAGRLTRPSSMSSVRKTRHPPGRSAFHPIDALWRFRRALRWRRAGSAGSRYRRVRTTERTSIITVHPVRNRFTLPNGSRWSATRTSELLIPVILPGSTLVVELFVTPRSAPTFLDTPFGASMDSPFLPSLMRHGSGGDREPGPYSWGKSGG